MEIAILPETHLTKAFSGSNALATLGSEGKVSSQLVEPIRRRKAGLQEAHGNVRNLQDVGVQILTMREFQKQYVGAIYQNSRYWALVTQ